MQVKSILIAAIYVVISHLVSTNIEDSGQKNEPVENLTRCGHNSNCKDLHMKEGLNKFYD